MKLIKLSSEEFDKIYNRVPRLCVEVVVKTNEGVILTKRSIMPYKGAWHLPGGTVMKNEKMEKTVKRIAKEELGIKVAVKKMLGVIEYIAKNHCLHAIGIAFLVKKTSNNKPRVDKNAEAVGFFKSVPDNTIKEQREFLLKLGLIKAKG